jgi:FMN phosphatase YigB (HAD superfamily)
MPWRAGGNFTEAAPTKRERLIVSEGRHFRNFITCMVHTVVFDLGKVLVDFDYHIAARAIASRSRTTMADLYRMMLQNTLLIDYELGKLTTQEFFDAVRSATGFGGDIEEFGLMFGDIFSPIQPMIELHAQLRRNGLQTYIFSNTNELAVRFIRRRFPFFADFDAHILSFEHGAMKPDAKLYEVVERVSGRGGVEILYVDDRPENIAAGAERGWQVVLQESPEKTRSAIHALGLV